jgi:hypothetical protein
MTPEQKYLRDKIKYLTIQAGNIQAEIAKLKESCEHHLRDLPPEIFAQPWMSIRAECEVCGTTFSAWRCRESPDRICHYHIAIHPELKVLGVVLMDGRWDLDFPQEYQAKDCEPQDDCFYCGMPDKRQ